MTAPSEQTIRADRLPILAAVMAGGKSRRMGTDKRVLTVGGQSMLSRVVHTVSSVCERTVVVVAQDESCLADTDFGPDTKVIRDAIPGVGPLGGLLTALSEPDASWVLAVAADMPLIHPGVIRLLWESRSGSRAVVAVGPRGREPLLALYHVSCRDTAQAMVGQRRASPLRLLEIVPTAEVQAEALRTVDPQLQSLLNVNTPSEYSKFTVGAVESEDPWPPRVSAHE